MVAPLCIVVAIAIVCIVVAALTSAWRADDVALDREEVLFTRALVNHGEWSLRRLKTVAQSNASVAAAEIDRNPAIAQQRIASWLDPLHDHDKVLVFNSGGHVVFAHSRSESLPPAFSARAMPRIRTIVEHLRERGNSLPEKTLRLDRQSPAGAGHPGEHVFLQDIDGRLGVVAVLMFDRSNAARTALDGGQLPYLVALRLIGRDTLAGIGDRLQLDNLRLVSGATVAGADHLHTIVDEGGRAITRFAWTPLRPGAQILRSVIPFIGIALAGFALLTGLVLRYMRHTAAAIAAGENRLRHLALHDPLCGLPNRNYFGERLETVIANVRRGGAPAAVFYIDLDHFKDVNDTLGHPIGDELIRSVTLRLSRTMRGDDLVARLGGDEFAVITQASADHDELQAIAGRIIATLCAPYSIGGHTIVIGASIGIALVDGRAASGAADTMRYADMALYRAKNEGRNRACIYDSVMDADLSQRKLVEQDLREAIERDELKLLYQPIVNASGEKVMGVEALARWPHRERGMIPPGEFIPIAEHSGLIVELGARVLRRACLDGKAWPDLTVAVNVSPLQFRQIDFVSVVERTLSETGFEPGRLELELTESTLLGNFDNAEIAMRRLRALGVKLALDDFGTGYSSLLYLRRFPFDKLKIDRSFVLSIEKAADAAAIVHAIVSLGRGLGMKVTAEGVETAEQHLFLRAAGVHLMQGFRFGVPCEAEEIAARLAAIGVSRDAMGDARAALAG